MTNDNILPYWKQDESIAFQVDRLFWFYDKMNAYEINVKAAAKAFEIFQLIDQAIILSEIVPEVDRPKMQAELHELQDIFTEIYKVYVRVMRELK